MKKYLILILTIFTLLSCIQKSNSNDISDATGKITTIFSLKDYQQDFNQMVEILLKNHPQPYAFISKDSFKNLIDSQYERITDTTTMGGFMWICKSVVAAINCGHTDMWFSNKSGDISDSLLFPMIVKYVGSKLYIIDALENSDKMSAGDEILRINGVDVERLQKEIFQHISTDGFNESAKFKSTNVVFNWYCSLHFDFPDSYTITVKRKGKTEEIKLKQAERIKHIKTFLDNCDNQLCLDINQESSTAIMIIRSFAYYGKKRFPIFKSFIDSCFYEINENRIQHLIIDLRNNGGGNPFCGSYLLQHIAKRPYSYFHKDVKRYSKLKKTIQPSPNTFENKPYILIDGFCFSTSGHFCSLLKENNLGIFIGDETGGTYTCNDNSKMFNLENTKILLKVARNTYKTTARTLTNEHGIIPDYYVIPNIDNILNNTDTVLNYTLRLIENE